MCIKGLRPHQLLACKAAQNPLPPPEFAFVASHLEAEDRQGGVFISTQQKPLVLARAEMMLAACSLWGAANTSLTCYPKELGHSRGPAKIQALAVPN